MKWLRSTAFQITAVMLLAAAWKMVFFFWDVVPFNSDEAVVALMARHILAGERPVFFYGQAYMGSLDAFLVAGGFWLFGQQVWVIRLVQALLYLATLLTTLWLGRELFNSPKVGILAGALLAVPTVNVMLYTTASLGGYGEALLIGNALLIAALVIARRIDPTGIQPIPWLGFALFGLLVGLGLWANGLTLVYSLPAGLYLLWALWQKRRGWLGRFFAAAGAGFLVGSLPWWVYAAVNGPGRLVLELFGTAVAVEKTSWLARTGMHLVNFLLLGTTVTFGLRPPWDVRWLALPLMPLVLAFWLGALIFFFRKLARKGPCRGEYALLGGVMGMLLAGFLFTPFGVDPSGRYFLPLAVPLALIAAQLILSLPKTRLPWGVQAAGLVLLVVAFQFWGTLQSGLSSPPGLTTQFDGTARVDHRADGALIEFLRQQGETRGYSNYWIAYPLAFQSYEELIFVPRLPYHQDLRYTPRDDRYEPYTALVAQSPRAAYITSRCPLLDAYLREHFAQAGVTWQEQQIGDYRVYYHLSRLVRPQEIGLGALRE